VLSTDHEGSTERSRTDDDVFSDARAGALWGPLTLSGTSAEFTSPQGEGRR
jgi:hypothetical protein